MMGLLHITVRDLQYRWRQFAVAIVGSALAFSLALILVGVRAGFHTEARDTVESMGADGWVVPASVTGPFTGISTIAATRARELRRSAGVQAAEPLVAIPHTLQRKGRKAVSINVIGYVPQHLGEPRPDRGRAIEHPGEAVVADAFDMDLRSIFRIAKTEFRVVGKVDDRTYLGGVPVVYVPLRDAQRFAFDGQNLATAILFSGRPTAVPRGLKVLSNSKVEEDMLLPLTGATEVVATLRTLMWIVAAVIVAAVTYLSTLERLRDFAVLKAIGGRSSSLALSLCAQAVITSLIAAAIGAGLAFVLKPAFPLPITISAGAYMALGGVAVVVGLLASVAGLRRVMRVDPALAFSG
jgi:putative ABC transport system permease protein